MTVLVVLDGSKNDKFLLEESEKFTNSNKSNIFTLYVIEVTQKLEIDTQLEEEILLGENILKKSEKFLGLSILFATKTLFSLFRTIMPTPILRGSSFIFI